MELELLESKFVLKTDCKKGHTTVGPRLRDLALFPTFGIFVTLLEIDSDSRSKYLYEASDQMDNWQTVRLKSAAYTSRFG